MNFHRLPPDVQRAMRKAAAMPPLAHFHRGRSFEIRESHVCDWLCNQDEIRQVVFNWAKRNQAIQFDLESRQWRGAAWREHCQPGCLTNGPSAPSPER